MFLIDLIDYWLHPKYVVMRGIKIENRMIMYIGANPVYSKDDHGNKTVSFSNCDFNYYATNIYKRIWTLKELIKWRRLIGKTSRCLRKNTFSFERV